MLIIDGSYGEGGGSVLRVAVGLAVCLQRPIRVMNIRKNRPKPGLKTQHLLGLQAVSELCGGTLRRAELGSTEIEFEPAQNWKQKIKVNIPTAGSVGLVLQILQLACVFAPTTIKVEIIGGSSYTKWAPPLDFLKNVLYKHLYRMGYNCTLEVEKEGFYPKGGCKATAILRPIFELKPINYTELGSIEKVVGRSVASSTLTNAKVAERQKISARKNIYKDLNVSAKIEAQYSDSLSRGSGITLWLETTQNCILGSGAIGERGLQAEKIGEIASQTLTNDFFRGNTIDLYCSDQLIPYMALCKEVSHFKYSELSEHAKTNIWVCEQFLGKRFRVIENSIQTLRVD